MKNYFISISARALRGAVMIFVLAFTLLATPVFVGCSDEPVDEPEKEKTEGVVLPSKPTRNCGASGATIKFTVTTDAGYKLEVDNPDMISIRSNSAVSKAGTYSVDLSISRNTTGEERRGVVYITVEGYSRIKVLEVVQTSGSLDEVVTWVDERLQNEYYWLDEYNEKLTSFDYSLAYNKYLSSSLLSLTTNMQDGGVDINGNRYIYSYIIREEKKTGTSSQTRADENRKVMGYGIKLSSALWAETTTTYSFAVEHVYPDSPAANAGVKRGDVITHINGNTIPRNSETMNEMWSDVNNNKGTSITIEGETFDKSINDFKAFKYVIESGEYEENPVAYSAVVQFDKETTAQVNPDGSKKIGHLVYLTFDNEYDDKLIEAVEQLAAEGITDLILDLRVNSGGSVNSSITLGSMILPESYIGKTYGILERNPNNKRITENDECLIERTGFGDFANKDLPNLNLEKVWVITSSSTASASEMIIKGFEGLDVEVNMVGKTTEGKNCGMDVEERSFNSFVYTYAPITFINKNAKGDSNYADGITPQHNFEDYIVSSGDESVVQRACRIFPMPEVEWWDMQRDFATYETALQICGYTLIPKDDSQGNSQAAAKNFKPIGGVVTRAGGRNLSEVVFDKSLRDNKIHGATLTADERMELTAVRE